MRTDHQIIVEKDHHIIVETDHQTVITPEHHLIIKMADLTSSKMEGQDNEYPFGYPPKSSDPTTKDAIFLLHVILNQPDKLKVSVTPPCFRSSVGFDVLSTQTPAGFLVLTHG